MMSNYAQLWEFFTSLLEIRSVLSIGCCSDESLQFFKKSCKVQGIDDYVITTLPADIRELFDYHDFECSKHFCTMTPDLIWVSDAHLQGEISNAFRINLLETFRQSSAEYIFLTHPINAEGQKVLSSWSYWMERYGYELSPNLTRMARTVANVERGPESRFTQGGVVFRKKAFKKMTEKESKDAVLTWASGTEFCKQDSVRVFVNSLNACGFAGDKLMFTHDMGIAEREYFVDHGFKVIDAPPGDVQWVVRDRFLTWQKYLMSNHYRHVMCLDSKDIVFFHDPTRFMDEMKRPLYFVGEGKTHGECMWNTSDQSKFQKSVKNFTMPYHDWEVICGGTIFGYGTFVRNLLLNIWTTTLMSNDGSDQAALNYLYHGFYKGDGLSYLVDPRLCEFVATADLPKAPSPVFRNGSLYHHDLNQPYYMWHQWDRVESLKGDILNRFV